MATSACCHPSRRPCFARPRRDDGGVCGAARLNRTKGVEMKRALCCATLALALAAGCAPDQPSKIVLDEPAVVAPPPVEQLADELRERVAEKVEAIEAKIDAAAREAEARVEEFTERLRGKIETKAEAAREWLPIGRG